MRVYVLDKNTTLVLNEKVFVLAREKKVTKNSVCDLCSLNDICTDDGESHHFSSLCIPYEDDYRWFFLDCQDLSEGDKRNIWWNIEKCLDIDF